MKRYNFWRRLFLFSIGVVTLLVMIALMMPGTRARAVMAVSSWQQYGQSPLSEKGIRVELPVGDSWFRDMLFYHDSGNLKAESGQPLDLSIYYTFGAFRNGRSLIYSPGSGYYSSFYGAYLISAMPLPEVDAALVTRIAAYDYENLILSALGHPSPYGTFKVGKVEIREHGELLGFPNWTCYDVDIEAPGVAHERGDFRLHYWQFGSPLELGNDQPYESVDLNGRVYVKVFEEDALIVMVYLICESTNILEHADARLQESGNLVIRKH